MVAAPVRVIEEIGEITDISLNAEPSVFPGAHVALRTRPVVSPVVSKLTERELTQPKGWVDPHPETVVYPQPSPQPVEKEDAPNPAPSVVAVALSDAAPGELVEVLVVHGEPQPTPVTIPTEWEWDEESRDWVDPDDRVPRHREPARVARNRAHHRAQAELCRLYPEEFEALKTKHLERAKQEQILLAGRILRPGERRAGESVLDRVKAEE
jgi:hypothetical protein